MEHGIPGLVGTEHIGFTVPDLDEAERFFVDVIGCEVVYSLGPFVHEDDWMSEHLNVQPRILFDHLPRRIGPAAQRHGLLTYLGRQALLGNGAAEDQSAAGEVRGGGARSSP